jgi:hypothetical protein
MLFKLSKLATVQHPKIDSLIHARNPWHDLCFQFLLVSQLRKWTLTKNLKFLGFDGVSHHFVVFGWHLLELSVKVLGNRVDAVALWAVVLALNIHILLMFYSFSFDIRLQDSVVSRKLTKLIWLTHLMFSLRSLPSHIVNDILRR